LIEAEKQKSVILLKPEPTRVRDFAKPRWDFKTIFAWYWYHGRP